MDQIEKTISQEVYGANSWKLYTQGLSTAFFDVETTGLSHVHDSLILGGLLLDAAPEISAKTQAQFQMQPSPLQTQAPIQMRQSPIQTQAHPLELRQYLADSPAEEDLLLNHYIEALSLADVWISYNGDSFDIPFLAQRLKKNKIDQPLPLHHSLDLYRLLRRYWPVAKLLPDLKQTSVETALGLDALRTDRISGKESADLYTTYLSTKNPQTKQSILLHNHDDLLMLCRILPTLSKLDLHRILFENGFLIRLGSKKILIKKSGFHNNVLQIQGYTEGLPADSDVFFDAYHWHHQGKEHQFSLTIPFCREKNTAYVDLEAMDMDFIPLEQAPAFASGYLLLWENDKPFFREINHMIKIMLMNILGRFY